MLTCLNKSSTQNSSIWKLPIWVPAPSPPLDRYFLGQDIKNSWKLTFWFNSIASSLTTHVGNRLVNSLGSCPAQINFIGVSGDAYFASRNSNVVCIATRRSACHRMRPDPVDRFVSPASWPISGHQPCQNQRQSPPASTRKMAATRTRLVKNSFKIYANPWIPVQCTPIRRYLQCIPVVGVGVFVPRTQPNC